MSIKSKLLTAVTTAGLLASLFGTALLPVAKAAAADRAVASANINSSDTDVDAQVGSTFYVTAGKPIDVTLDFNATGEDGDDTIADTLTITLTGTTFGSVPGLSDADCTSVNQTINGKVLTCILSGGEDLTLGIKVTAPAAGVSATITVSGLDSGGWDDSAVLIGVAAGTSGVPYKDGSTDYTWMESACHSQDSDGMGGGGAACSDTDYIEYGGHIAYQLHVKDVYGNTVNSGYFVSASVTGAVGGIEVNDNARDKFDNNCSGDDESASSKDIVEGTMEVCFFSDGTPSKPVTITVTVGSITWTRKVGVLGDVATLSLSAPAAIATIGADNLDTVPEAWGDSFAVVAKDSAGNVIGNGGGESSDFDADGGDAKSYDNYYRSTHEDGDMGFANDINFVVTDSAGAVLDHGTEDSYVCYDGSDLLGCASYDGGELTSDFEDEGAYVDDGADSYSYAEQGNGVYTVPEDFCDLGDEGAIRKVKVTGGANDLVSSNTVTVTCAEDAVKLSGATQSVTTQVKNGSVKFTFSATDGNGSPVGDGATRSVAWESSWGDTGTCSLEFMGGAATCSVTTDPTLSGAHFVILSVTDNDPFTTGVQAWAQKYTVSVTNAADAFTAPSFYKSTVVKARAVAIFPGAAGKTITFTVENARTGVVRTYYRKANADGKAWYTIAARGTYYVTALYDGNSTNTIRLVK